MVSTPTSAAASSSAATRTAAEDGIAVAAPTVPAASRLRSVAAWQAGALTRDVLSRLPGLRAKLDRPRTAPLRSASAMMYRWWKSPYGTAAKPASLLEIPWDYVEAQQDEIPFLGLREYWYPAVRTGRLRNNAATPLTLLGDHLVLFRDAQGRARALENRCPHRNVLLSLGQVGVLEPGTITCRYHGMTFDGDGECVAFLADGPGSPACGKIRARSYPVTEQAGIVFVYMGEKEAPPLMQSLPHGETVLARELLIQQLPLPYSHLNILDNATDLGHVGTLHRTCAIFADQKPFGDIGIDDLDGRGVRAYFTEPDGHAGGKSIDEITWYLPNLVYHGPGEIALFTEGWLWFVPHDVGSTTAWLIMGLPEGGRLRNAALRRLADLAFGTPLSNLPGADCVYGGDAPMQASQGRVVRWDSERLARTDRPVVRVRRMLKKAHAQEIAERTERGTEAARPRLHTPGPDGGATRR